MNYANGATKGGNDEEFFRSLNADDAQQRPPLNPEMFEDIIRKDRLKKKFVQKFTNLFNEEQPAQPAQPAQPTQPTPSTSAQPAEKPAEKSQPTVEERNSRSPSPELEMVPSTRPSLRRYTVIERFVIHPVPMKVQVMYSNMNNSWEHRIVYYVNQYWNPHVRFGSVLPMLLEMERDVGPGWRLDKVIRNDVVRSNAVPNSTITFCFPPNKELYSIWRRYI
ncbi:unnamed protein product [Dicrocoelium dendriticum]|nr:unnamed protein product [Dicrocoelium dendriticum]